jgi:hypothetical protein
MTAAEARRIVHDLEAETDVAKLVADAPPLTDEQRVALRGIVLSPNATKAALAERPSSLTATHRTQTDERTSTL